MSWTLASSSEVATGPAGVSRSPTGAGTRDVIPLGGRGKVGPAFFLATNPMTYSTADLSVEAKPPVDIDEADTFAIVADDRTVDNASIRLIEIAWPENGTTVVKTATQNLRQFGTPM